MTNLTSRRVSAAALLSILALALPASAAGQTLTEVARQYLASHGKGAPVQLRDVSTLSEREYLASRGLGAPAEPRPTTAPLDPGFDWTAAAAGAGGAAAIIALVLLASPVLPT